MKNTSQILRRVALITGLVLGGFGIAALADFSAPSGPPPSCPAGSPGCDAPLNLGYNGQTKQGGLWLKGLTDATHSMTYALTVENAPINAMGGLIIPTGAGLGKVLTSDASGAVSWQTLATERRAYFGGMYGTDTGGAYTNPLAGNTRACPSGYKGYLVIGSPNIDYGIYVCYGVPGQVSQVAVFGGAWGPPFNNPATGSASCPAGFNSQIVMGRINVDNAFTFCYSTDLTKRAISDWGGFYGGGAADNQTLTYYNPITGGQGCLLEDTATQVFGTYNVDYPITLCYKP